MVVKQFARPDIGAVVALTRQVRAAFNRLKALGDQLHRDLGVTAAMRAVIEVLHENGARTVPAIARAKRVSRQHIQTLANALASAGLIVARDNPADRRSPLIALTPDGAAAFAEMTRREAAVVTRLARDLTDLDLPAANATLARLCRALDAQLQQEQEPEP